MLPMKVLISLLLLVYAGSVFAADTVKTPAQLAQALGISPKDVRQSPIPGMYEVRKEHLFGYVTTDGKYLIQGDLVNLKTGEQITEEHRRQDRLASLAELGDKNMVTYAPAPPIKTRHLVTVFTDVTCQFCRRLHSEMAAFNQRGIAIRYAFYPRSGPDTAAFREAEAVWCSKDRNAALDIAFADAGEGKPIPQKNDSCSNPVLREYKLGQELGLRGTPMLILPNGEKIDGYLPPKDLASALDELSKAKSDKGS